MSGADGRRPATERLLARVTRRVAAEQVRHVAVVPATAATGLTRAVYQGLERDFGMLAPPVSLHAPSPVTLAGCWVLLRETLIAGDGARRAVKEATAAAVSAVNRCPYCEQVHGATLAGLRRRDADGARAGAGQDPLLLAAGRWAGGDRPAAVPESLMAELTGVAVAFHYLNRMVNIFLGDPPLAALPARMRPVAGRAAERMLGRLGGRSHEPGTSLGLLPPASAPPDLRWAGDGVLADALARVSAAVDARGLDAVPAPVAELVSARLAGWDGAPAGLDARGRFDADAAALPPGRRATARLLLLTAFASYRVTDADVRGFRRERDAGDAALLDATAWAALAAARRWGTLLSAGR